VNSNENGRIAHEQDIFIMKSYKNIYSQLCSFYNLYIAYNKARKNKSSKDYVLEFDKDKIGNINQIKKELKDFTYEPRPLKKFILRDPKTRVIRKSKFRDRIVHHALVNILEPIYEDIFISDSYANRKFKGTSGALKRFDEFKRKVSENNSKRCFILKADIKHFFDSVNHEVLLNILKRRIKDNKMLWLINLILKNFDDKEKGMPLGNMTSQFFANVYLNELDYFVKHDLKIKYYLRYVDDFVIFHKNRNTLEEWKKEINHFLYNELKLELHKDKSKVVKLEKGIGFLGYRIFYYYKLLRKRNLRYFKKKFEKMLKDYENKLISYDKIIESVNGWLAYAEGGDTYKLRNNILKFLKNSK